MWGRYLAGSGQVTPSVSCPVDEEVELDSLKGLLSTDILQFFCLELECGLGALIGHFFPVYRIFSLPLNRFLFEQQLSEEACQALLADAIYILE